MSKIIEIPQQLIRSDKPTSAMGELLLPYLEQRYKIYYNIENGKRLRIIEKMVGAKGWNEFKKGGGVV